MKFVWHLGCVAAEVPVKFQSDCDSVTLNLVASRLPEMLQ